MAFYQDDQDEEKTEQGMNAQPQQGQSNQPIQTGTGIGADLAPGNIQPATPKTQGPKGPASSGMSTGFQAYSKANQGNAQNRLNQAASQNVQNQGQIAKSAINQATTAFGQKVDTGSLANRGQAVQDVTGVVNAARNVTAGQPQQLSQNAQQIQDAQNSAAGQPTGTPSATGAQAAQNLSDQQKNRFQEVINAKYQGPESLRQAGLYQLASGKVGQAQNTLNQTKNQAGREEMLKNMYQQRGDYSAGLNKLDAALLNANKQGVSQLQEAAKAQGNLGQKLDQAQLASANLAQNRTQEIKDIQNQARNVFTEGKKAEEAATEERLASVIKDWDKLPEHFKNIIRNKEATNKAMLDEQVAKYNQDNKVDTSQIAGLDKQIKAAQARIRQMIDYERATSPSNIGLVQTTDEYKAVQDQLNNLNAQKGAITQKVANYDKGLADLKSNFNMNQVALNPFEAAVLGVQSGQGLYNLGENAIKTGVADKTKLISKDEQLRQSVLSQLAGLDRSNQLDTNLKYKDANLAGTQSILDSLDVAGTRGALNEAEKDFQRYAEGANITGEGKKKNKTSGKTYRASETANLGNLLKKSGYEFGDTEPGISPEDSTQLLKKLSEVSNSQVTGDSKGLSGAVDATVGGFLNPVTGQGGTGVAQDILNAYGTYSGLNLVTGALGLGGIGNAIGGLFGGGTSSKESKAHAKKGARKDLTRKINAAIDSSGFENRLGIDDSSQASKERLTSLQQLLANLDKTNT